MAIAVFTCDSWKSTKSMRLIGVFTSDKALRKTIRELKEEGSIQLEYGELKNLKFWSANEINERFSYLYLQQIKLNMRI